MTSPYEVILVGSGMNSLACAALLARRGLKVLVLERNAELGGCIRSEQLFPGFTHDLMSQWYPLFVGSPAYAELKDELAQAGLRFAQSEYSTGVVLPDGRGLALKQDLADTVQRIDALAPGDGQAFGAMAGQLFGKDARLTFGLLGQSPYAWSTATLLAKEAHQRGLDGMLDFAAASLESFRRWADRELSHELTRALIAPWVLHSGLGPDEACSAVIGKLTFAAVVAGGMPVVEGGSQNIVEAFRRVIEGHGGALRTRAEVSEILIDSSGRKPRASGVRVGSEIILASRAVVCNVTPPQLYGRLWPAAPQPLQQRAQGYRFGRGCMQIHFALKGRPPWRQADLGQVPLVHLTESMEQVCASVVEAANGWLPARPTLAIGQPVLVDPSRAPAGDSILWIQMQELPARLKADAAGEIAIPADGQWTEAVREAMADRVQARLERVMPGLGGQIIGRHSCSPADLQRMNCNLVGGDPYSGVCSPDQFFWMRPFASTQGARGHRTPCKNLFQIGASTHPGPGLGAGSGFLVAQELAPR